MAKQPPLNLAPVESWHVLQSHIHDLSEDDCQRLIEHELANDKRQHIALRLYVKMNKLRDKRERAEIMRKTSQIGRGRRAGS